MEPRTTVGMASEHSEGLWLVNTTKSPRPTPVSHETVCVLLCLVCLALDCGEICGGMSVEFSRRQFYSYKISPEVRRIFRRVSRRTLRLQTSPANFAANFATKLRRQFFAERTLLLLLSICHVCDGSSFIDVWGP